MADQAGCIQYTGWVGAETSVLSDTESFLHVIGIESSLIKQHKSLETGFKVEILLAVLKGNIYGCNLCDICFMKGLCKGLRFLMCEIQPI